MSRRLLALSLVLAVAFAGCSALAEDSEPTPPENTVTPMPVPSETPTHTVTPTVTPPGVSPNGTVDLETMRAAHERHLTSQSYTFDMSGRVPLGGSIEPYDYRVSVSAESTARIHLEQGNLTLVAYGNETDQYLREYNDQTGEWNVSTGETLFSVHPGYHAFLMSSYLGDSADRVDTVTRGGTTYARVFFTGVPEDEPSGFSDVSVEATNYTATAYVRPDGFLRTVVVTYSAVSDGETKQYSFRLRVTDLGNTTVEEPDWVRDIRANRTTTGTPAGNGTADGQT